MQRLGWGLGAIAIALAGCAHAPSGLRLAPAPSARQVIGVDNAIQTQVAGMKLIAQANAWRGGGVLDRVTPVRVEIEDHAKVPLVIEYARFALVSAGGNRYAALPPYRLGGTVETPIVADSYAPITRPAIEYTGFSVAPYYAPLYPTIGAYSGAFPYDPVYYDTYAAFWHKTGLPSRDMLRRALPEGVLQPGGRVSGFLYFEPIAGEAGRVALTLDLVDARKDRLIGFARLPFVAAR